MSGSSTPVEDSIRQKINSSLSPTRLTVRNDSALHSHHQAMIGNTSRETHFALDIVSEAFKSKMQPARHRMVYALLKEEMDRQGGIHALSLRTKTSEEDGREKQREQNGA